MPNGRNQPKEANLLENTHTNSVVANCFFCLPALHECVAGRFVSDSTEMREKDAANNSK